jgi:hypothetical protein
VEIGMLQVFSKKRLMNYPKDCSLTVFFRFTPLLLKRLPQEVNPFAGFQVFRFAGKPTFGFSFLLVCGLEVLRAYPQTGLRLCGFAC